MTRCPRRPSARVTASAARVPPSVTRMVLAARARDATAAGPEDGAFMMRAGARPRRPACGADIRRQPRRQAALTSRLPRLEREDVVGLGTTLTLTRDGVALEHPGMRAEELLIELPPQAIHLAEDQQHPHAAIGGGEEGRREVGVDVARRRRGRPGSAPAPGSARRRRRRCRRRGRLDRLPEGARQQPHIGLQGQEPRPRTRIDRACGGSPAGSGRAGRRSSAPPCRRRGPRR